MIAPQQMDIGSSHTDDATNPVIRDLPSTFAGWRIVGARARGASHEQSGLPCQDAVAWYVDERGFIAALADGAGSAPASELGAQIAVDTAVTEFRAILDRRKSGKGVLDGPHLLQLLMQTARDGIEMRAAEESLAVSSLATTLSLVTGIGDWVHAAQVGDGSIVFETPAGISAAVPSLHGEYANEATFLTSGDSIAEFTPTSIRNSEMSAFALSSDGLYMVATEVANDRRPYRPFFADAFKSIRNGATTTQVTEFLQRVDDRTGDDKSLIVAARNLEGTSDAHTSVSP